MHKISTIRQRSRDPVVRGMALALVAALAYGTNHAVARQVVTEYTVAPVASFFALLFAGVTMSLYMDKDIPKDRGAPKRGFMFMALAGIVGSAAITVSFLAFSYAPVVIVSPITGINPLIALVLAHLFLQRLERVTFRICTGAVMAVLGVTVITLSNA